MSAPPSPEPRPKRVTPFLVRVFVRSGTYHPIEQFQEAHTLPLSDEYGVYVWPSSTLSTILASLFPALPPPLQSPSNKYSFRSVYFDARAGNNAGGDDRSRGGERLWRSRELGRIDGRDFVRELGVMESSKTLEENRFHAGDYLCLSIQPPPTHAPAHDHANAPSIQAPGSAGMRINPRAGPAFGPGIGGAPRDGEKWSDARARGDSGGGRGGFGAAGGGGFGIRGRGATNGRDDGWGNARSTGGNGGGADAGWGRRRSASPKRGGADDGWGVPVAKADEKADDDGWGAVPSRGEDKSGGW